MPPTIHSIDEFNSFFCQPALHPFVAIGKLSNASNDFFDKMEFGAYGLVLMKAYGGVFRKNHKVIRYGSDSIITFRPGDILSMKLESDIKPMGQMLLFRPELIANTGLGRDFYLFNFFDFEVYEALELTPLESEVINRRIQDIGAELEAPVDELTPHMLRLGIGMLLSYIRRFYSRQFDTLQIGHGSIVRKLNSLLDDYLATGSDLPRQFGPPTVAWCAAELHLAPNYLGSLVKRELSFPAQVFIHNKILDKAKSLLAGTEKTINEVSETLGFSYPNHFARFFTQRVGMTPSAFRRKSRGI